MSVKTHYQVYRVEGSEQCAATYEGCGRGVLIVVGSVFKPGTAFRFKKTQLKRSVLV